MGEVAVEGYASLWNVADLNRDVTVRGCFAESLTAGGVKMLHQHVGEPVGAWDEMVEDERGLFVRGRVLDWSAAARFAQALVRAGALDGLSIGFRVVTARRDGALRVLTKAELWEVSLVTFPMLPGARLAVVAGPLQSGCEPSVTVSRTASRRRISAGRSSGVVPIKAS